MQTLYENLNILVVEDNPSDLFLLQEMLLASRLKIKQIFSASRLDEARQLLNDHDINLVLLDLSLPDSFGLGSLKVIRNVAQKIPVIILTGLADADTALEALQQNAQDYLVKGEFTTNLLTKSIEYSIERKKVEEKILASEDKYRQMFYKNPFPMWINDADSLQILEVNDAAIQKYGYERNEFVKLTLKDIRQSRVTSSIPAVSGMQEKLWKHKKKNGETIIVEFIYYPINYFGRTAMQAQVNDITENIRLETELNLKKQQLVEAVLNAQETERKNIGAELHDNINQILTAVKLNLSHSLKEPVQQKDMLISKSIQNTATAIEEIRKLSKELILPGNLKELGLVHSIENLLKEMPQLDDIDWQVDLESIEQAHVSEDKKLTIYRIVQEALNNILKHAQASSVIIHLTATSTQVRLVITDNGKGFDTKKRRNGIGITNMSSRAELFNGEVTVTSAPGQGCKLEVVLNTKNISPCKLTAISHQNMPS